MRMSRVEKSNLELVNINFISLLYFNSHFELGIHKNKHKHV